MPHFPERKKPAHGVDIHLGQPVIVFVTVCTKNRVKCLDNPSVHLALRIVWEGANAWLVGRYVVMPDHVHLFVSPGQQVVPLENWIRYWKSILRRRLGEQAFGWQAGQWDRRLRGWESYGQKWDYVLGNPVRHGLVSKSEEWPYQGEIHALEWG